MFQSNRLINSFDLIYDMITFGQNKNLTPIWPPGPRPFLTQGSRFEQLWKSMSGRSFLQSFVKSRRVVREKKIFLRFCAIFRRWPSWISDDLHFYKSENASPIYHPYEVCLLSAQWCLIRRRLKSLTKGWPFDLSAAILDDVIIRFQQKMFQSNRLINSFDLIYDMTTFGQKSNLTPIWPPGPRPFFTRGSWFEQLWKSMSGRSFIPSFVKIGLAVREKKIF